MAGQVRFISKAGEVSGDINLTDKSTKTTAGVHTKLASFVGNVRGILAGRDGRFVPSRLPARKDIAVARYSWIEDPPGQSHHPVPGTPETKGPTTAADADAKDEPSDTQKYCGNL
ncbi:hypothetical protein B0H17DRAFT_1135399 [Mycena rosella]|uniref:Uncharacterized protein n=1 Tax=Mycena rosella TaxID=1033263 RepID=A0AAD7DD62_MYCRO|nr:hypothetical protein B0H17DRAFT_1135399 [Mycena rosella]